MKISEIFCNVQGEGKNTGLPTIFIRFQGCNLWYYGTPCNYCDTGYGQDPEKGKEMSLDAIMEEVRGYIPRRVCITGGEPLFQMDDFKTLVTHLKRYDYYVEVETNGSIQIPGTLSTLVDCWSVDVKCPGSGTKDKFVYNNFLNLREQDQIKFVISNPEDLEFMRGVIKHVIWLRCEMLVSPCWGRISPEVIVDFIKEELPRVRLSMQIHKVIWGPNKKGV